MEAPRLYKDNSANIWKGPRYCAGKILFTTLDEKQERSAPDESWIDVDWGFGISLEPLNRFLTETQLDINVTLVGRARQVAVQAHLGQNRWNKDPYITHPIRVAASLSTDNEKIVGYLHDVVEDTDVALTQLRSFGFTDTQLDAIDSVTKRDGENYRDFVLRAKANPIGRVVKIADIKDNLSELTNRTTLTDKYELALWILEN